MAEIGIVASVVQVADIGLKLSVKLYDFAGTVTSADKTIASICKHVKVTSRVLKELSDILKKDKARPIVNETAVETASGVVKKGGEVFQEMENILLKRTPLLRQNNEGEKTPAGKKVLERLWWPYIQSKFLLLRSKLERLLSTLQLMLSVITYACMKSQG